MSKQFAAFSIGRRSIAVAIFSGTKLEFWQTRSFQASAERASSTVIAFLNWMIETFEIESAVLEDLPPELQTRMASGLLAIKFHDDHKRILSAIAAEEK